MNIHLRYLSLTQKNGWGVFETFWGDVFIFRDRNVYIHSILVLLGAIISCEEFTRLG